MKPGDLGAVQIGFLRAVAEYGQPSTWYTGWVWGRRWESRRVRESLLRRGLIEANEPRRGPGDRQSHRLTQAGLEVLAAVVASR